MTQTKKPDSEAAFGPFKGPNELNEWMSHLLHLVSQVQTTFPTKSTRDMLFADRVRQLQKHLADVDLEGMEALMRDHGDAVVAYQRDLKGLIGMGNHQWRV